MNHDSRKDPDSFQQAWKAQSSQTRVTVDSDILLKVVQADQQSFLTVVRLGDYLFLGMALLLVPMWSYLRSTNYSPWTWYLTMPVLIWGAVFTLVYRIRHKRKPGKPNETLLHCVERSLIQVEDQIWYQRNSFWWFLLPVCVSLLASTAHSTWLEFQDWSDALFYTNAYMFVFIIAFCYYLYYMNRRFGCSKFESRRQELLSLLASLRDESNGDLATTSSAPAICADNPIKFGRWAVIGTVLCFVVFSLFVLESGFLDPNYDGPPQGSGPASESLAKLIADLRTEKNLVGLAAMVTVDGQVEATAVHGERKIGSSVPLEIGDRWHLGGISKSITATMIGRLVEAGKIEWSDTVGEYFSDASIHEDWKPVTLKQLLTDTAGAPVNFPKEVWRKRPALGPECTQARQREVLNVLAGQPLNPPGEKYVYSNVGYTIAGAMAEQATGAHWKDLVKIEVSEPLGLTSLGLGPPKSPDPTATDPGLYQPRGHRTFLGGKVSVDDDVDNTPIMGPAGTIHMTLDDLCTYATEHLRGELGESKLLSAETYKLLHAPVLNRYAYGWLKKEPSEEIPHTVYWHNGSNTLWYALVVFIPEKNMVIAVTSNDGDFKKAQAAAWEVVKASVEQSNGRGALPLDEEYPKKSPFAAVRWQESQPEVRLGEEWFKLVSLNDLPAKEIVSFCRRAYGNTWQKRFEEDLVEVLTRMGYSPQGTVTLVVGSLTSSGTQVLEDIPMTEANRQAIRDAAQARESTEP